MGWKQGRTRQCHTRGVRNGHGVFISARAPHTLPGESYQARSTCSGHLAALGALNESRGEASLPDQPPAVVGLPDHLHDHPAVQRELVCLLRLVGPHNEVGAAWRERGKDVSAFWRESCGKRTRKVGLNFAHLLSGSTTRGRGRLFRAHFLKEECGVVLNPELLLGSRGHKQTYPPRSSSRHPGCPRGRRSPPGTRLGTRLTACLRFPPATNLQQTAKESL